MATCPNSPVDVGSQVPDPAITAYHRFDVARRMLLARKYAPEQCEGMVDAWRLLNETTPTTADGEALKKQAIALLTGDFSNFDITTPQRTFEEIFGDFIAADQEHDAIDPDDEDNRDEIYERRYNALFEVFATMPQTIGQAREILRASLHEICDCELTVGGYLPDAIELALANILELLDAIEPTAGPATAAGKAVRS